MTGWQIWWLVSESLVLFYKEIWNVLLLFYKWLTWNFPLGQITQMIHYSFQHQPYFNINWLSCSLNPEGEIDWNVILLLGKDHPASGWGGVRASLLPHTVSWWFESFICKQTRRSFTRLKHINFFWIFVVSYLFMAIGQLKRLLLVLVINGLGSLCSHLPWFSHAFVVNSTWSLYSIRSLSCTLTVYVCKSLPVPHTFIEQTTIDQIIIIIWVIDQTHHTEETCGVV